MLWTSNRSPFRPRCPDLGTCPPPGARPPAGVGGGRHRRGRLRQLRGNDSGGVAVLMALGLPVLAGFSGLGLDVSTWYLERRSLQSVVDSAALAAAYALSVGGDAGAQQQAADDSLGRNTFALGPGDSFQVLSPPQSGKFIGNPKAVEVRLSRPAQLYFTRMFVGDDGVTVSARAVGAEIVGDDVIGKDLGDHCVLALDETMDGAAEFAGTANADLNCGVASNSNSDRSIHVRGTAKLTADPAQAVGDIRVDGAATLTTANPLAPFSPPIVDPFGPDRRNLQVPAFSSCQAWPSFSGEGPFTVDPGVYCGDLLLEKKNVTFNPGTYVLDGGSIEVKAHSNISGTGVTFVLTGAAPQDVGTVTFTSQSTIDLAAPTTGEWSGVLIYQDRKATGVESGSLIENKMLGGSTTLLKGAIYAPTRGVRFTGGNKGGSDCLLLVARKITFTGNAVIENVPGACSGIGAGDMKQSRVRLIE
ncbi:MAG: hypothetical protein EA406_14500 [Rhodospirillales bacterium]|nr:MAG: hypothetical protein EA406_14500 [Rhodospirillales bacterium]